MEKNTKFVTEGAIIAALYVVLTWISSLLGLASGVVQVRISEALYAAAIFSPSAVLGLFIGCIISNIFFGLGIFDVIFGSMATLIGAYFARKLRKYPYRALIPPILSNTIIIPFVLYYYGLGPLVWFSALTVFAGEFISCGILGSMLYISLKKTSIFKTLT